MSDEQTWADVDSYFVNTLTPADDTLSAALTDSDRSGLPAIQVAPNQGALIYLLALIRGARRILEIGTLGGYSTIRLARALPADGRLISCELEAKHAEVATANVARAGLADKVEVRVGPAADTLQAMVDAGDTAPFDLVFIDADKENNRVYLERALKLTKPGSVIVVDNVVRNGEVANAATTDPDARGSREVLELIAAEPRLTGTAVQTVGSKGYDGFALAVVTG
jgi:predicted O-methyltransferase YrrM